MDATYASASVQRLVDLLAPLPTQFNTTYDRARTLLFFYVVIKYGVKSVRHLRARGTFETFREGWGWLSEVRCPQFRVVVPTETDIYMCSTADLAVATDFASYDFQSRASDDQSQERY